MRTDVLLRTVVEAATPQLDALSADEAAASRGEGKWSAKQGVGHLIDSACNNHSRFVRAQFGDDLVFDGYDQEAWVAAQRYDTAPWHDLVALWRAYNLHIAHVVEAVSPEVLERTRSRHNLDRIAWQTVPSTEPVTLAYFVRDYVGHMENHLLQILPRYEPISFSRAERDPVSQTAQ